MHLGLNYQSVHLQHPMDLVKGRYYKQSEKNMTLCNAKIQVLTDCRSLNVYMYRPIYFIVVFVRKSKGTFLHEFPPTRTFS